MAAPPLISNCWNLPFGTQGRSWRLEPCLQEPGQKGLCAWEPHRASLGFSSVLVQIRTYSLSSHNL